MHMPSCHYVFTHVRNFKSTDLGEIINFWKRKIPILYRTAFQGKALSVYHVIHFSNNGWSVVPEYGRPSTPRMNSLAYGRIA